MTAKRLKLNCQVDAIRFRADDEGAAALEEWLGDRLFTYRIAVNRLRLYMDRVTDSDRCDIDEEEYEYVVTAKEGDWLVRMCEGYRINVFSEELFGDSFSFNDIVGKED